MNPPTEKDGAANVGPGARLAAVRERMGFGLVQVAERLHLDVPTLEALEAERYGSLGAAVYVRGHLRRYAELLGESPLDIEALYAERQDPRQMPDLTRLHLHPLRGAGRAQRQFGFWPATVIVIVLALACLIWWALRIAPQSKAKAQAQTTGSPSAPAPTAGADRNSTGPEHR